MLRQITLGVNIYDTSGIFSVTREDKANVGEILDLKLTPDLRCVNEACDLLYDKIISISFDLFFVTSEVKIMNQ